jgi:hypothetical protein
VETIEGKRNRSAYGACGQVVAGQHGLQVTGGGTRVVRHRLFTSLMRSPIPAF